MELGVTCPQRPPLPSMPCDATRPTVKQEREGDENHQKTSFSQKKTLIETLPTFFLLFRQDSRDLDPTSNPSPQPLPPFVADTFHFSSPPPAVSFPLWRNSCPPSPPFLLSRGPRRGERWRAPWEEGGENVKEQYSVRCREKNHWRYREGGISRWMNAFQKAIFKSVQETQTFTPFSEEEKRLLLSF